MTIAVGAHLGSYQVTALLGEGGMGRVFRAHDPKLKRDVAIKVLPDELSRDPDRVARFEREAETLASLNHANIAHVYGLEDAGPATESGSAATRALVMELVEGPTLADRIARGPLPLDDVLSIARQLVDAVSAAHEHGVVHRDLKPANIKLRPDGVVKVLDFGLAKALDPAGEGGSFGESITNSPTMTARATQIGIILGTAAYMAPEQAKGRKVDRRADIWAFGVVLFEMLTGRRPFEGDDASTTLAAVIMKEPEWTAVSPSTPASIRRLLRRCLEKDPGRRLRDIVDALFELDEAQAPQETPAPVRTSHRDRWAWRAAAILGVALVVALVALLAVLRPAPAPPELRLDITTPATAAPFEFALSPDGRSIVFVASGDGAERLWLRALDKTEAQPMTGTEGAQFPFWSPDSRSIGFFVSSKLYRVDVTGGPPQALASFVNGRGGTWNAEGVILFGGATPSPIWRIAATGGEPVAVTRVDPPRHTNHRFPQFLPDGRHFLFHAQSASEEAGVFLGSLDGKEPKRLTPSESPGAYLSPDRVVFMRQGALVSRRLDLERGELTHDPVTLADPVGYDLTFLSGGYSVSAEGHVAYRAGGATERQLTWVDRTGKTLGAAHQPDTNNLVSPELSPDGRRVAVGRTVQGNPDVWLVDLLRGGAVPFTRDAATDNSPVWSPNGTRIAFASNRQGGPKLYLKASSGVGAEDLLRDTPNAKMPQDWSRDGRFLLYSELDPKTSWNLWVLDMTGNDRKARVVVNTPADERLAQFSPDGHFVAYETNESGRFEIVVQPFPDASVKWPVSTDGGTQPRWRADGKELYFISPDGNMMAASIAGGKNPCLAEARDCIGARRREAAALEVGRPVALFPIALPPTGASLQRPQYAVAQDGRFLINQPIRGSITTPITLILNWKPPAN